MEETTERSRDPVIQSCQCFSQEPGMLGVCGKRPNNLRQGGVERWRDTRLVLPPGFSVDIGRGWGDQMRENKLQP